jgi:hypothetical protein
MNDCLSWPSFYGRIFIGNFRKFLSINNFNLLTVQLIRMGLVDPHWISMTWPSFICYSIWSANLLLFFILGRILLWDDVTWNGLSNCENISTHLYSLSTRNVSHSIRANIIIYHRFGFKLILYQKQVVSFILKLKSK